MRGGFADWYQRLMNPGVVLGGFFLVYVAAAAVFQWFSKIMPWEDGSPVDIMNGSMIWMTSMIALMMALLRRDQPWLSLMWLAGSAALGAVALDEFFGVHEHAAKLRDDDDPKIVMALGAAVALAVLAKAEKLRGAPLVLLAAGFVFHCFYLLSDLGDGDFFDITFDSIDRLRVAEEGLEFTAMGFYLASFVLILLRNARPQPQPAPEL